MIGPSAGMLAGRGLSHLTTIDAFLAERERILEAYRHHLEPAGLALNPICRPAA